MQWVRGNINTSCALTYYCANTARKNTIQPWYTPYKFSGKEKDEETNYSYFGARYFSDADKRSFVNNDSDLSVWLSAESADQCVSIDPMSDKYPSMSAYMYCAGNPVMLVDPNGREDIDSEDHLSKRAKRKFDNKIWEPLKAMDDAGYSRDDVQKKADQLADKYQNRRWFQYAAGKRLGKHSPDKKYVSRTTNNTSSSKIKIIVYPVNTTPVYPIQNRTNNGSTTNGTTPFNVQPGDVLNIQCNPYFQPNSLQVNTNPTGPPVINTGMINDPRNSPGNWIVNASISINSSNSGNVTYSVTNTLPNANDDNWDLNISVTSPSIFNPTLISTYPY